AAKADARAAAAETLSHAEARSKAVLKDAEQRTTKPVSDAEDRLAKIRTEREAVGGCLESPRGVPGAAAKVNLENSQARQGSRVKIQNAFRFGLFGGLGVLLALAIGAAIGSLATILTYIGAAIFLALGLDPAVSWLERHRFPRWAAILTVVIGVL